MSNIKGLLFDFNGTLFFDSDYHMAAMQKCCKHYGVPTLDRDTFVSKIFGMPNSQITRQFYIPNATDEQVLEFEQLKESTYISMCYETPEKLHLTQGADDMFDYLKANSIPYCIATGSPLCNVEFYFEALGLGRWFTLDNIVYTDGTFKGKPHPDIYLRAAQRLGLKPEECAVFEDATAGVKAARAAGAAKVIAVWEEGYPAPVTEKVCPDAEYHDFLRWKEILADLGLAT